ncbi:MAG: energy transducer TonB [Flavobacteriales bacterium]|nr:energy transducer TonB [Flavobacteriales bacterium]
MAIFLALCVQAVNAQHGNQSVIYDRNNLDGLPSYPGGDSAMYLALQNCDTSIAAGSCTTSVKYTVSFTIEADGSTSDVEVSVPGCPLLEISTRCAVARMARWIPARSNGRAFPIRVRIPFRYDTYP